jgi:hypothetical protein
VRIVMALRDRGVGNMATLAVCASGRALMSAICSRTSASVLGAGASDLC